MFTFMLLLAIDPPASDLDRFPDYSCCLKQVRLYQEHERRLMMLASIRGWEDGFWQHCQHANDRDKFYWETLASVHKDKWTNKTFVSSQLAELRSQIGWWRYYQSWHPPIYANMPADLLTEDYHVPFYLPIRLPYHLRIGD